MPKNLKERMQRLKEPEISLIQQGLQKITAPVHETHIALPANDPYQTESMVDQLLGKFSRDAERTFAFLLPVGKPTPDGVNPGALYCTFRAMENPKYRDKEIIILFSQADQIARSLSKSSSELLRNLESLSSQWDRSDPIRLKKRKIAIQMAKEYPRALLQLLASVQTQKVQADLDGLRRARFFLQRAEQDWPSFERRMRDTPPLPVEEWCARVREMQSLSEMIRRAL